MGGHYTPAVIRSIATSYKRLRFPVRNALTPASPSQALTQQVSCGTGSSWLCDSSYGSPKGSPHHIIISVGSSWQFSCWRLTEVLPSPLYSFSSSSNHYYHLSPFLLRVVAVVICSTVPLSISHLSRIVKPYLTYCTPSRAPHTLPQSVFYIDRTL
jgi:hypothetical protein